MNVYVCIDTPGIKNASITHYMYNTIQQKECRKLSNQPMLAMMLHWLASLRHCVSVQLYSPHLSPASS